MEDVCNILDASQEVSTVEVQMKEEIGIGRVAWRAWKGGGGGVIAQVGSHAQTSPESYQS